MAEQYSWLDASGKGYSAGQHGGEAGKLMEWSRNTVADGRWLNRETIKPFSGRDQYLLASLNQTYDECSAFSGDLQYQINVIEARADVVDVVGSYSAFVDKYSANFDPTSVSDQDVVKILNDETSANAQTYYRWLSADNPTGTWIGVGSLEPSYSNANISDGILTVNNTNTGRNYTLSGEKYIELNGNDKTGAFGLTDEFISSASQCYTALTSHSASWNKTSAWVYNNSANIVDASATLYNNSANWQATYSAVSSNSAIWSETAYVPLSAIECKIGSANSANEISFAQGKESRAETISFAQGLSSIAQRYSFTQGLTNSSTEYSFTQGISNIANNHSIAQGVNSTASNYSQAFGYGAVITNTGMAIGSYNKTSANVAFVIGDGTNDTNRSDLYWIDHNGNVSAKGNITATNFYINGTPLNCTHTYTSGINANQDSYDIVKMNIYDISAVQTEQQMQRIVQTLCLAVSANNTNKRYALWPEEYSTNTAASHSDMYIPVFDVKTTAVKKSYIKTSDLNLGNYVSAGNNQKLTMISADNLTLGSMQPGIIYLV